MVGPVGHHVHTDGLKGLENLLRRIEGRVTSHRILRVGHNDFHISQSHVGIGHVRSNLRQHWVEIIGAPWIFPANAILVEPIDR